MNRGTQVNEEAARNALRAALPTLLRDSVLAGAVIFALAVAISLVIYNKSVSIKIDEALNQLRPQAQYLASLIDAQAHARLTSPQQTNSEPYQELVNQLQNVRSFYPTVGKLFTGRYLRGHLLVILDTFDLREGPNHLRAVATPLDIDLSVGSPEITAITSQLPYVSAQPALHPEGQNLGIIVPLVGGGAGVRDFLYLDTSLESVAASLSTARKVRDGSIAFAALFAIGVGLVTFLWRSKALFRQSLSLSKLRENEELFRSTYELSPVAMCLTDTEGRITQANKAFCDFLNCSENRLRRLQPTDYTHPDDLQKEQPLLENLRQHQASQYQVERRYRRQDGFTVWGLVSVAVVRDPQGHISHYMTQVVDITERKRAEETLRLSQERLSLAANAGKVGMWDCDLETGAVVWNDVMHEIYLTDPALFVPSLAAQEGFIHPENQAKAREDFERCLHEGGLIEQEYRIALAVGEIRYIRANTVTYRDEAGHSLRAVGSILDISAEKQEAEELIRVKEDALAADKAKSEFLAVMSHEIRTPLNGVLGFVSMLKNTPLNSEQMSYVETMEDSGQDLLVLVNDILDVSKIETSEIHIENSTFEIRPFIQKLHQQLHAQAAARNLEYNLIVESSVPKAIHTDPIRLSQLLANILGNAIKFTEKGRVDLRVNARPVGIFQKNWQWIFSIRDTGPGITREAQANLFKLFHQVDSSTSRRHGGTGLGLALSKRIARLLDGDIRVRSEMGRGTEFIVTVTVPRGQSAPPVEPPTHQPPANAPKILGKRVLVVEDNPINRKLCALQLQKLGCETSFAETGTEAVEKVRGSRFDAVLMDMQLPGLDGCDATREIRSRELSGERLSIIALTANAMPEDRKRCLEAGMDDFLSKPLQYDTLAATLSKWV